jgi:hypothetical protein
VPVLCAESAVVLCPEVEDGIETKSANNANRLRLETVRRIFTECSSVESMDAEEGECKQYTSFSTTLNGLQSIFKWQYFVAITSEYGSRV